MTNKKKMELITDIVMDRGIAARKEDTMVMFSEDVGWFISTGENGDKLVPLIPMMRQSTEIGWDGPDLRKAIRQLRRLVESLEREYAKYCPDDPVVK